MLTRLASVRTSTEGDVTPGAVLRWSREGDDYVIEWPHIMTLRMSAQGQFRSSTVAPGVGRATIDKLSKGMAAAFSRSLSGEFSLHASAVARNDSALVCVGDSGAGKSSAARFLCQQDGVTLLSDDVAGITHKTGEWFVSPSESAVWVTGEDAQEHGVKLAVPQPVARSAAPIRWIALLEFDDAIDKPILRRLKGTEAAASVLSAFIRFEPTAASMKRELELAIALLDQAVVLKFTRPHALSAMVGAAVLQNVIEKNTGWVSC